MDIDQHQAVRPRLSSDPPGRKRDSIPYYDTVRRLWKKLGLGKGAKPLAGAAIVGGTFTVIAMEIGVGELVLGTLAAYAAYRMLRYGISLKEALTETVELERAVEGL